MAATKKEYITNRTYYEDKFWGILTAKILFE